MSDRAESWRGRSPLCITRGCGTRTRSARRGSSRARPRRCAGSTSSSRRASTTVDPSAATASVPWPRGAIPPSRPPRVPDLGSSGLHRSLVLLVAVSARPWQVATVWGVGVALAIYRSAGLSGAHLSPAISLAFALLRDLVRTRRARVASVPPVCAPIARKFFQACSGLGSLDPAAKVGSANCTGSSSQKQTGQTSSLPTPGGSPSVWCPQHGHGYRVIRIARRPVDGTFPSAPRRTGRDRLRASGSPVSLSA
jgi:hypothetical protein